MRDEVPYAYKCLDNILCILNFVILSNQLEDKRFRNEKQQAGPKSYLFLI
jgi:hypothetical protein